MICAVPLLRALRRRFPDASLALMTSRVNHDVMKGNEYLDDVILFDKASLLRGGILRVGAIVKFLRSVRKRGFDLCIVPATVSLSLTSDFLAFVTGARTRIGPASLAGASNPSSFFYTMPVHLGSTQESHRHQTLRTLDVVQPVGVTTDDLTSTITLTKDEIVAANRFVNNELRGHHCLIFYHPGAGKIPNQWPASHFALVANILSKEFDTAVAVTCGPMDHDPVRAMTSKIAVEYTLVQGRSIRDVAAIVKTGDLLITNDTGIMHVGGAVGTPVLSLFGPTDPHQWAPKNRGSRYILSSTGRIEDISVDTVLVTAREMLRSIVNDKYSRQRLSE